MSGLRIRRERDVAAVATEKQQAPVWQYVSGHSCQRRDLLGAARAVDGYFVNTGHPSVTAEILDRLPVARPDRKTIRSAVRELRRDIAIQIVQTYVACAGTLVVARNSDQAAVGRERRILVSNSWNRAQL